MTSVAERIEYRRVPTHVGGTVVAFENDRDAYILHAPLARNRAKLESDGKTIFEGEVRAGMLGVVVPGEVRRIHVRSPGEGIGIVVPGSLFRRFIESESGPRPLLTASGGISRVANLMTPHPTVERLARTLRLVEDIAPPERQLFLQGMVLGLTSVMRTLHRNPDDDRVRRREGMSDTEFRHCTAFAEAHVDRRLDIASWAAAVNMTTNEFGRRFQRKTGTSPYHWLLELRIDRARMLLERSDVSLSDVALQLGFCSQSHFTDTFRRRHGVSPGSWRKKYNRDPDKSRVSGSYGGLIL